MKNNLDRFFSTTDFDVYEPQDGHLKRFEKKLNMLKSGKSTSFKWMSIAASILILLGFWLGVNYQSTSLNLADISPEMKEVQHYFVSTIHNELKTLEKHRSIENELLIEETLNKLEDLEYDYSYFRIELKENGYQKHIIAAMIKNYQQRLELLENVLKQLTNKRQETNESYI